MVKQVSEGVAQWILEYACYINHLPLVNSIVNDAAIDVPDNLRRNIQTITFKDIILDKSKSIKDHIIQLLEMLMQIPRTDTEKLGRSQFFWIYTHLVGCAALECLHVNDTKMCDSILDTYLDEQMYLEMAGFTNPKEQVSRDVIKTLRRSLSSVENDLVKCMKFYQQNDKSYMQHTEDFEKEFSLELLRDAVEEYCSFSTTNMGSVPTLLRINQVGADQLLQDVAQTRNIPLPQPSPPPSPARFERSPSPNKAVSSPEKEAPSPQKRSISPITIRAPAKSLAKKRAVTKAAEPVPVEPKPDVVNVASLEMRSSPSPRRASPSPSPTRDQGLGKKQAGKSAVEHLNMKSVQVDEASEESTASDETESSTTNSEDSSFSPVSSLESSGSVGSKRKSLDDAIDMKVMATDSPHAKKVKSLLLQSQRLKEEAEKILAAGNAPSLAVPASSSGRNKLPSGQRQRIRWSKEETDALISGVQTEGAGRWNAIKELYHDALRNRTTVDIKDKWRNLVKYGKIRYVAQDSASADSSASG